MRFLPPFLLLTLSLSMGSAACQRADTQDAPYFSRAAMGTISKREAGRPNAFWSYTLFLKTSQTQVARTNLNSLINIYTDHYQQAEEDFPAFLGKVLNQQLLLDSLRLQPYEAHVFTLNDKPAKEYARLGTQAFLHQYTTPEGRLYRLKEPLSSDELDSIAYVLFFAKYWLLFDDYSNTYYLKDVANELAAS